MTEAIVHRIIWKNERIAQKNLCKRCQKQCFRKELSRKKPLRRMRFILIGF